MTRRLAILVLSSATVGGCWGPGPRDESFVVAAPLAEARIWGEDLYVRLSPGRPLLDAVAVPVDPLKAGMTIDQARRTIGLPLATRTDPEGTYYLFRTHPARIELAHLSGPGSDGGTWEQWSVAVDRGTTSVVFAPSIQELIVRATPVEEITIHEQRRPARVAFSADLRGQEVSRLRWYSIAEMPE